jgi:hypothetical protein
MEKNNKRLVILQTKSQALEYYLNYQDNENDFILPIGPESMYISQKYNSSIIHLGEFWEESDYKVAKQKSENRIDDLVKNLNNYSLKVDYNNFVEIGNYYSFQLWVIIGQIHYNQFIIQSIFNKLNPKSILCFEKTKEEIFLEYRPDPDRILVDILKTYRKISTLEFKIIKIRESRKKNTYREKILSLIPSFVRYTLRNIRDNSRIKNKSTATNQLLLLGGAGDWIKLHNFEEFNCSFKFYFPPKLKHCKSDKLHTNNLTEIINKQLINENFTPINLTYLIKLISNDLNLFINNLNLIKKSIKIYDAIVSNVFTFPLDLYFAHVANSLNLPVIVWQHGEKGQAYDPTIKSTELLYSTNYFCYADSVKLFYEQLNINSKIKYDVVGSVEKNIFWKDGKSIVYATGKWFKTATPFIPKSNPDKRLYDAHNIILNFLTKYTKQFDVIFRPNNSPGLNDIPYSFNNIHINFDTTFTKLLEDAALVILDTPATTLVESCSTEVPIFVLGGRSEYNDEYLLSIKRRVIWKETPEELITAIENYILKKEYPANILDTDYLNKYCANAKKNQVVENVINSLNEAINTINN